MIGGLTNYAQLRILNALKGGRPSGIPTTWRVAAFSTAAQPGGFSPIEANYPGYGRVLIANNNTSFSAASGSSGTVSSSNAIAIPFPAGGTGANQTLTGVGFYDNDASVLGGGNLWLFWAIPSASQPIISAGTVYNIPIANLVLQTLCSSNGGYSDYAAKNILNALFGGAGLIVPSAYYIGGYKASPTPVGGGTESQMPAYQRQLLNIGQGTNRWNPLLNPLKIQSDSKATASSASLVLTLDKPSTDGDLLLLNIGWQMNGVTITGISDNNGNQYQTLLTQSASAGNLMTSLVYCRSILADTNPTITITITFSATVNHPFVAYEEWQNVDDIDWASLAVAQFTSTNETTNPTIVLNPGISGEIIAVGVYAANVALATNSGWTLEGSVTSAGQGFFELQLGPNATDGAYTAAPCVLASAVNCAMVAVGLIPMSSLNPGQSQDPWGSAIVFGPLGNGNETWNAWAVSDSPATGAGNLWEYGQLATPVQVTNGAEPQLVPGSVMPILISSIS
jgi:hypothetical protein